MNVVKPLPSGKQHKQHFPCNFTGRPAIYYTAICCVYYYCLGSCSNMLRKIRLILVYFWEDVTATSNTASWSYEQQRCST